MECGDSPTPYDGGAHSRSSTLPELPAYPPTGLEATEPEDSNGALGRPRPRQSFYKRRIAPIGIAILAFLAKIKSILLLLPKIKFLVTAGSMAVSIAAYTTIWGFWFAMGFVVLLLVHEMGHVIQLRREGIHASAPMFIPFLGAVVASKSLGRNALAEARVGLAGPVLGSIGCLVPLAIYGATGSHLFQALAFTGFFLNLFNLAPVVPLDGGRAMAALSPWMWLVGFALLVAAAIVYPNPIIFLILVFGAIETYRRFKTRKHPQNEAYYKVPARTRLLIAAVYIGLAIALVLAMDATHLSRVFSDA
jgi:Zn-dependent protease